MKKLMITTILSMFASSAAATSYVKDVRDVEGKKGVDVVVVDKLCHVTVIDHENGLQAELTIDSRGDPCADLPWFGQITFPAH